MASHDRTLPRPYEYPERLTDQRRHGPFGYVDYGSFKDWLRDEFQFRCVYCLNREMWEKDGHRVFGVDHLMPKGRYPDLECDYDNLLFSCNWCNTNRRDEPLSFDPAETSISELLHIRDDGTVQPRNPIGRYLCDLLWLNEECQVRQRQKLMFLFRLLSQDADLAEPVVHALFGYPTDLPDLAALRPPGGNTRPDGVHESAFAQRTRGELPEYY